MNYLRSLYFLLVLGMGFSLLGATEPLALEAPASTVASDANYAPRINYQVYFNDYLATKKGQTLDLIFIGDSITELWRWGPGNPVWKKHFENRALDFGLGSDQTQHTIWRLKNIDVRSFKPKVAVLLIGTNNTNNTPEDIAAGVKAVIGATQDAFSGIKIILVSILPNRRATEKMAAANQLIEPLADGETVVYLDLASQFTPTEAADGANWRGLGRDRLHLTTEGYEVWADALEAMIPKLLAKQ